jgi:hypothetical protein
MHLRLRTRFWLETLCAAATGLLALITALWHDWIELVFGVDPDAGNGAAEWLVVVVLVAVTAALALAARYERRRAAAQPTDAA